VDAFLNQRIAFLDIPRLIADVLDKVASHEVTVLEDVLQADERSRRVANDWILNA
jgi:1-deoxy-D-xylulose-5-phosphate reductoisomerase